MSNQTDHGALHIDIPKTFIPRKPVNASPRWVGLPPGLGPRSASDASFNSSSPLSAGTLVSKTSNTQLSQVSSPLSPSNTISTTLTGTTLVSSGSAASPTTQSADSPQTPSKLAKAWEETKFFAGGLINHPTESTKHFSVLRHSHGLVLYQGPATSVAISIFSSQPLPEDRKLWLQQKGWTGKTGWKAKQLFGANGGWLDVTPSIQALPEQLPKSSERAWQRDCKKFWEKEAHKKGHSLRETCIVRIPCEAEDGYFRIVVCGGGKEKKKLCPSPIFRVMSLSTAPSSLKGASLTTLPLEASLKLFTTVANNAALSAAQPLTSTVQNAVGKYIPSFWQQQAASAAYEVSGLQDKVEDANTTYQGVRDVSYQHVGGVDEMVYEALDGAPALGSPSGPQHPYPIKMSSTVVAGSGKSFREGTGTPTANLKHVREEVTMSLHGLYFGWARVHPSKAHQQLQENPTTKQTDSFFPIWHPSIIKVSIIHDMPFTVTYGSAKSVSVYLIHDFQNASLVGSKIEVLAMGFLRPLTQPEKLGEQPEDRLEQDSDNRIADIAIVEASLARPAWAIEAVYASGGYGLEGADDGRVGKLTKSVTARYVEARQAAQRQVDRVPVHKLGMRRNVDALREQAMGTGGIYVVR